MYTLKTYWKQDKGHRKLWIAFVIIIIIIGGQRMISSGSLFAPRTVSLTQQLKNGGGTHIWFMSEGRTKDSQVQFIDVVKDGKLKEYQIFDDDITLGNLSKMSNDQIASLGKKQDRKFFNESSK